MSKSFDSSIPSDIRLLLRADAEQCWLSREVIPVLQHLEERELLPEEEVRAGLAYLEAMWDEAMLRARETDAAHAHLRARDEERPAKDEQPAALSGPAGRYHAAVRVLRGIVTERVTPLVDAASEESEELGAREDASADEDASAREAHTETYGLRVKDVRSSARCPNAGGYTPRAA
jgi:hypothetical protein